ncbi:hypothetical protein ACNI3Q_11440 [Sphingomonas sp. FW199]|uniref:hypothetical protein n=1 Tax=Sphingomonas sp. FW199 TaxID=3400217 RepID=UPI003CEAFF9A
MRDGIVSLFVSNAPVRRYRWIMSLTIATLLVFAPDPKEATVAWMHCVSYESEAMAISREAADLVVTAAFGACQKQEDDARSAWAPSYKQAFGDNGDPIANLKAQVREVMTARVIKKRMALEAPKN